VLCLSLLLLSPLLFVALEQRLPDSGWRQALVAGEIVLTVAFMLSVVFGPLAVAFISGIALNSLTYVLLIPWQKAAVAA
jgi:hypothetical protein